MASIVPIHERHTIPLKKRREGVTESKPNKRSGACFSFVAAICCDCWESFECALDAATSRERGRGWREERVPGGREQREANKIASRFCPDWKKMIVALLVRSEAMLVSDAALDSMLMQACPRRLREEAKV